MRILFLTHRLPCPPDRGCKLRSAAILYGLAQRHDVWCAGFLDSGNETQARTDEERALTSLRQLCQDVLPVRFASGWAGCKALGSLLTGGTASEAYFASRSLARGVREWAGQGGFDAVFAFSSGIAPLALSVRAARRVLCMDDLDSRKWQELAIAARWPLRHIYDMEARRLARREAEWIDRFDATLMVSQREAGLVSDPRLRSKVHVLPPILPSLPNMDRTDASQTGPIVGFVGAMDYEPNIDAACWLAREIWPRVLRSHPDARLWIVGRSPAQVVRNLASADTSIVVTGTVPSVEAYLRQMRVHVAPIRIARGVQMKVVAAMAAGRPCVVTSAVADSIGAQAGREMLVADSPAGLAQSIVELLEHSERAGSIGLAGRRFLDQWRPEQAIARLERLLAGDPVVERTETCESVAPALPARRRHEFAAAS
jgi:polysaccharide biosynthesis protein PslH